MTVAEHIRQSISSSALKNRLTSESYGKITASFGVASFIHGERLDDFIQRADEALYRAKRDGRNRIEMALDSQLQQFG
jgi:diguanylate cyclase